MVVKTPKERKMVVCYRPGDVPMMDDPDNPGTLIPDDTWLITEDDLPVDSEITEKESRLLTEPLYANWPGPKGKTHYMVMADIGLFFSPTEPPLSPDIMLVVNPKRPTPTKGLYVRSYFVWRYGKVPDVVIEIVSNRKGGEQTRKLKKYAEIGVSWYVIFDPEKFLSKTVIRVFRLDEGKYQPHDEAYFPTIGLGLKLWKGNYENWKNRVFLRWCDSDGEVIPTGAESTERMRKQAQIHKRRAILAEQRAEQEKQRAEQEKQRAEQEMQRADKLAARLRALGANSSTNGANGK